MTPQPFRYKPNYVAAWLDRSSEELLQQHGIRRRVHLTTFFDGYGQLSSLTPYLWSGTRTARIAAIVEWAVGPHLHLIAEMADCSWAAEINAHYRAQGPREDHPHRPHVTLDKRVEKGAAAAYQALVGTVLTFERHGREVDDRPPFIPAGDIVLRDWQVDVISESSVTVHTPPFASGLRESYAADVEHDKGFYLLAKAIVQAQAVSGALEVPTLVEAVTMAILEKEVDPVPGVNWACNRTWRVNDLRDAVRKALDSTGITRSRYQGHAAADEPYLKEALLKAR